MFQESVSQIFKILDVRKSSHMMTDVPFWLKQFSLLANANFEHVRGIQKVIYHQSKYVETMKENGLLGKDENMFYREVSSLNDILRQQMDKLTTDANEYINVEKSLKSFEDKFNAAVTKLDMKYRTTREKLCYQTRNVETQKKEYHKLCFATEKAEIKAKMTNPADAMYETRKKLDELQEKTNEQMKKYNKHIEKWKAKFEILQKMSEQFEDVYQSREEDRAKMSEQFEDVYKSREEDRAKTVLAGLQNSIDLTMAGNYMKRERGFTRINAGNFVEDTLIQTENVTSPKFEVTKKLLENKMDPDQTVRIHRLIWIYVGLKSLKEYKGETDRNVVYMNQTRQTEVETLRHGMASPEASAASVNADNTNNRENIASPNIYVVIRAYEKQKINQLNLKLGEHVTEILPANEDGFAYGHVIHGLLHKKKKGFFPVDHVVRLQEEVTDSANDDKSKKRKTKKRPKSGHVIVDPSREIEETENVQKNEENDRNEVVFERKVESDARRRRREKKKKEEDMVIELL